MPLQNRVDPFGRIHAVQERGMFTGNRGVIHDPATKTLLRRRWTSRAWIVCACDFKGVRRVPMGRNARGGGAGWTELFFLDEVTALAAGHRPCFYCRRGPATDFTDRFRSAFGSTTARAADIDRRLHAERRASAGTAAAPAIGPDAIAALPEGAMVAAGDRAFAVRAGPALLPWSFAGYGPAVAPDGGAMSLLTPPTTIGVLRAGYRPVWHVTARGPDAASEPGPRQAPT